MPYQFELPISAGADHNHQSASLHIRKERSGNMRPPGYDRGLFRVEIWKSRIRRFVRQETCDVVLFEQDARFTAEFAAIIILHTGVVVKNHGGAVSIRNK